MTVWFPSPHTPPSLNSVGKHWSRTCHVGSSAASLLPGKALDHIEPHVCHVLHDLVGAKNEKFIEKKIFLKINKLKTIKSYSIELHVLNSM